MRGLSGLSCTLVVVLVSSAIALVMLLFDERAMVINSGCIMGLMCVFTCRGRNFMCTFCAFFSFFIGRILPIDHRTNKDIFMGPFDSNRARDRIYACAFSTKTHMNTRTTTTLLLRAFHPYNIMSKVLTHAVDIFRWHSVELYVFPSTEGRDNGRSRWYKSLGEVKFRTHARNELYGTSLDRERNPALLF